MLFETLLLLFTVPVEVPQIWLIRELGLKENRQQYIFIFIYLFSFIIFHAMFIPSTVAIDALAEKINRYYARNII